MSFSACSNVNFKPSEDILVQEQWWIGKYDFVSFYIDGYPNNEEQYFIDVYKYAFPSDTYGDTLELTQDGRIIDTQWGCRDSKYDGTTYRKYIIGDLIKDGTEERIGITRLGYSAQERDDYFIITKSGIMVQIIGGSDGFTFGWRLQKRSV